MSNHLRSKVSLPLEILCDNSSPSFQPRSETVSGSNVISHRRNSLPVFLSFLFNGRFNFNDSRFNSNYMYISLLLKSYVHTLIMMYVHTIIMKQNNQVKQNREIAFLQNISELIIKEVMK